jgi:hypothetical protein
MGVLATVLLHGRPAAGEATRRIHPGDHGAGQIDAASTHLPFVRTLQVHQSLRPSSIQTHTRVSYACTLTDCIHVRVCVAVKIPTMVTV